MKLKMAKYRITELKVTDYNHKNSYKSIFYVEKRKYFIFWDNTVFLDSYDYPKYFDTYDQALYFFNTAIKNNLFEYETYTEIK